MSRPKVLMASIALVIVACGGSGSTATTTGGDTTTTEPSTTSHDTATAPESSSSAPGAAGPTGEFAITGVDFAGSLIEFTNVGLETSDIGGMWVCQGDSCFQIASDMTEPGEQTILDGLAVDGLDPGTGELALYRTDSFESPEQMLSYVEWGDSGHMWSSVADLAGLWPDGGFVATDSSTAAITTSGAAATDPSGWTAN